MSTLAPSLPMNVFNKALEIIDRYFLHICIGLCLLSILSFWPGLMSLDSNSLLEQAQNQYYKEGHSPILAYLWHWLLLAFPNKGSGILVVNQLMLWGSVFLGGQALKDSKWKGYFLLLPFLPHFFLYSGFIWKDVFFTQGYLFVAMYFAYKMVNNEPVKPVQLLLICLALIVFTGAKYQARFALPFLVTFGLFAWQKKSALLNIFLAIILSIGVTLTADAVNEKLVGEHHQTHFWQFVKIYDLAGISVFSNDNVIPEFLWKQSRVTVEDIEKKYTFLWEPLIRLEDSPLNETRSDNERTALKTAWFKAVAKHPMGYLQHRFQVWKGNLVINPLGNFFDEKFGHIPLAMAVKPLGYLTCFAILLPILLMQIFTNCLWKKKIGVTPSIFMSLLSLSVLSALFIFSLSSTPRYVFFTNSFFWFGLPFWVMAWQCQRKKRL